MKTFLTLVVVLLVAVGGVTLYLFVSTPSASTGVQFPLSPDQQAFVAKVPATAESFAFVPGVATLEATLRANPVTRQALESWRSKQKLPSPWMIGGADLLTWRADGVNHYLFRLDPLRAMVVRLAGMIKGDRGNQIFINDVSEDPIDPGELAGILGLAAKLPHGQALVVQRQGGRGAYPPIARPAVTSVAVTPTQIDLVSRADLDGASDARQLPTPLRFPQGAMLTSSFANMPRLAEDLNRLFGTKVSALFDEGGSLAIYDVDSRKLLPRPLAVIAVPADDARRSAMASLTGAVSGGRSIGVNARTAEKDGQLLLSFDDSLEAYQKDTFGAGPWPAGRWGVHADPSRLVPALQQMSGSVGLRIAAPRLFRTARDLNHWIEALQGASSIDAADSVDPAAEELKVRITSK